MLTNFSLSVDQKCFKSERESLQNVYFTLYRGLRFHDASFEMQTVGWRAGMGGGQREDESFVVLGFNELENTIALF